MLIRKKHPFLFYCRSFFFVLLRFCKYKQQQQGKSEEREWVKPRGQILCVCYVKEVKFCVYVQEHFNARKKKKIKGEEEKNTHTVWIEYIFISFAFIQYFNSGKKLRSLANKKFHHTTRASFVIVCSMWDWMILLFHKMNGFLQ